MGVNFFDNETNYRYRIREAPQQGLLMEVQFFDSKTNYRYRIRDTSKRSFI